VGEFLNSADMRIKKKFKTKWVP